MNKLLSNGSIGVLCSVLMLQACSSYSNKSPVPSVSDTARAELAQPVNCKTAKSDIRILENEKASVGKQMLSGVRSIMPISAVAGILMGDYTDRVQVATGRYNDDLETKIAQIKKTCGVY